MASANWQKHSGGTSVKAQFRHCDKNERLKVKHANEEIDTNLTYKNLSFGIFQQDYKSACHAYDERIEYIDKHAGLKKKPRKDRVTCVSWSIPQPEGMSEDMASKWFTDVYALLTREYSEVLGASAHFDEVHEYVDASTGEIVESRPHMHVFVLPVVEKDGFRRLIGKDFSKRDKMIQLNNSIQKLTEDKYPGYTFMTGVKHPGKYQSVEDSKRQSRRIEERVKQGIEADKSNALQVIAGAKNDALDMAISLDKQNAERESELNAREAQLDERESKMEEKEQFMQWSYPTKAGKQIPILRLFEMFRKELKKAENEKKQSLPKHSSAPKPVDYVQKAMVEAIKPVVNKAYEDVQENMKRRVLPTLDYSDEDESDEYSY